MGPRTMQKWINALRSGEYDQGAGDLFKGGQYCCLGVLCDVLGYQPSEGDYDFVTPKAKRPVNAVGGIGPDSESNEGIAGLPLQVRRTLADWNDQGVTFEQISDWLEEYLEQCMEVPVEDREFFMRRRAPEPFVGQ